VIHNLAWCVVRDNAVSRAGLDGIVCEAGATVVARRNRMIRCERAGILATTASHPDLGRSDDRGLNAIDENREAAVSNELSATVSAIGNWWGSDPPDPFTFHGSADYADWLSAPE
jgi:hypothetical protein